MFYICNILYVISLERKSILPDATLTIANAMSMFEIYIMFSNNCERKKYDTPLYEKNK